MTSDNHLKQDRQSLMLHIEAVKLLDAEPALANIALASLIRWDEHVSPRSKPLREQWFRIIKNKDWALALEESERGNQLRQASPLTTLLPQAVRLEIIRSLRTKSSH